MLQQIWLGLTQDVLLSICTDLYVNVTMILINKQIVEKSTLYFNQYYWYTLSIALKKGSTKALYGLTDTKIRN